MEFINLFPCSVETDASERSPSNIRFVRYVSEIFLVRPCPVACLRATNERVSNVRKYAMRILPANFCFSLHVKDVVTELPLTRRASSAEPDTLRDTSRINEATFLFFFSFCDLSVLRVTLLIITNNSSRIRG